MKSILIGALLFFVGAQTEQMIAPKVEHHTYQTTETHETVTRSCPAGYEGHYVDKQEGFDSAFPEPSISWGISGYSGPPVYSLCFKVEFMEQVRKNPDLSTYRPEPPHAVEYQYKLQPFQQYPQFTPVPYTCTLPNWGATCSPGIQYLPNIMWPSGGSITLTPDTVLGWDSTPVPVPGPIFQ